MAFDPVEFFRFAHALIQQPSLDEASLRSCVSRAYYSAFLVARDRAKITNSGQSVHDLTARHYVNRPQQAGIGNRLNALRTLRNQADYDLMKTCSRRDAQNSIAQARKVLLDLGALS